MKKYELGQDQSAILSRRQPMSSKPQPLTPEELEQFVVALNYAIERCKTDFQQAEGNMIAWQQYVDDTRMLLATIDAANARIAELECAIVAFYRASESYNLAIETREDVKSLMGKANIVCDMLNNISDIGNAIAEAEAERQRGEGL